MDEKLARARKEANFTRYRKGQSKGHYESFFQRANHPERPLAFWIRYTIFSPHKRPQDAIGELWAIHFNGETGTHIAAKTELPMSACTFGNQSFSAQIGEATLAPGALKGAAESGGNRIEWDLTYAGGQEPLMTLPLKLYTLPLPKAKALVGVPLCTYKGGMRLNGEEIQIDDWIGSQNHNWGSKHTDYYAWGQVAGFDNAPDSFLEVATAQIKLGPVKTPLMTPLVLRHGGEEYAINALAKTINKGSFTCFDWNFDTEDDRVRVKGRILGKHDDFVGLNYYNPPGGDKHCLNSKIASCEVTITFKGSGKTETLTSKNRAAFEILTDARDHGVEIRA
jgi:hypothetical protein